ncbi:MAG: alpha amylase C-terminal domain-containing protein, partial [Methylobacteriaceae bacterium]|nr:alpha amylase C-terminal domain-containing protein [Methylobacteriaceae bacterium]
VDQTGDTVIVICNLTPAVHHNYRVGIREPGVYRELINTDSSHYGGSNVGNLGSVTSEQVYSNGREHSLSLTLPPLATLYLVKAG